MDIIKSRCHRLLIFSIGLLFCLPQFAMADFVGVYVGAGSWKHTTEGKMNHQGTEADMEKDFGYVEEYSNFIYIAVEHPFPLIPNIRISRYGLETKGAKTVTASSEFTFAGTAHTSGTNITTKLRWDEEDTLLYYEFLDNIVSFDLGLGMKKLDAEFTVTSGGVTDTLKIEEDLPIYYVMVGAMIPGTGISFSIETTQTIIGDADISQTNTKITYETAFMLGIEAGYRTSTVNLDEFSTIDGQIEFNGPFINALFHF